MLDLEKLPNFDKEEEFLAGLTDSNGQTIGPKILEAFLEEGSCIVFGPPGSGKTTVTQTLRTLAQKRMAKGRIFGAVNCLPYDQTLDIDLQAQFGGKSRDDMTRDDIDQFSDHLTQYILQNRGRKDTLPRWLSMADLVGIGGVNLGKTTLQKLSKEPGFIFIQVIPTPPVLNIAEVVRSVAFPLASSEEALKKFESRLEREQLINPDITKEEVTQIIKDEILTTLKNFHIETDIDDPEYIAYAVAQMGGPTWINRTRASIIKEATRWRAEGLISYPITDQIGNDLQIHIAHGRHYRNNVLQLPSDRTFDVVNYQQRNVFWRLSGLYEMDKAVKFLIGKDNGVEKKD